MILDPAQLNNYPLDRLMKGTNSLLLTNNSKYNAL